MWIAPDPYKHRAMRMCGVEEKYITGNASSQDKFKKWCEVLPLLVGGPLYHWSRMEIEFLLECSDFSWNDETLYERCNTYLQIKGLSFTKGGNGFPPPQRGILSTNCGNHWLIEDCRVLDANGVGADIGFQCPTRYSNEERGGTIVRNCEFSRCGIVGLTGTPRRI